MVGPEVGVGAGVVGAGVVGAGVVGAPVQAVPFRVNDVGAGLVPVKAPLKPNEAAAPVPREPL